MSSVLAEVLLADEDNNPLFGVASYGAGKVFVVNLPLEEMLLTQEDSFIQKYYNFYKTAGAEVLSKKPISRKNPFIGITLHKGKNEDYAVMVNYSDKAQESGLEITENFYQRAEVMQHSYVNFSSRRKVEDIITYINKHLSEKLTIGLLADKAELSPDYFAAQFKIITGFTIIQYINKCRIEQAKILLLNEEMMIKDVALNTGFCDEFYFSKTFKKYEGISPVNFIKNMR